MVWKWSWWVLGFGLSILPLASCSNQELGEIEEQSTQEDPIRATDLQPMERMIEPGDFSYPPESPISTGFPEDWIQHTQDSNSWSVLAGPGLLFIKEAKVQAFHSSILESGPEVGFYGTRDSELLLWEVELPRVPEAAPVTHGDSVIWALPGFGLKALDRTTGSSLWEVDMPGVFPVIHTMDLFQLASHSQDSPDFRSGTLVVASDRLEGLRFVDPRSGTTLSGPHQTIIGEVQVFEKTGLFLTSLTSKSKDLADDHMILSTLFPFSQEPNGQVYTISQSTITDANQIVLDLQFQGTSLGGVIHPSGQGLLIYDLVGSRKIEARHLTLDRSETTRNSSLITREVWAGDDPIGLDQGVRVQGSLDPRSGVWPLILISQDMMVEVFHGGVGVKLGSIDIQDLRTYLSQDWQEKVEADTETEAETNPEADRENGSSSVESRISPVQENLGRIFVPGMRSDRLIGLRILDLPGITTHGFPLFSPSVLSLRTPWGMYSSTFTGHGSDGPAKLVQEILPQQNQPRTSDSSSSAIPFNQELVFISWKDVENEPFPWNLASSSTVQLAFPAQLSPLTIRLIGQDAGSFFFQNLDEEVSPLLVQVFNQDHMVYTNASHVSLESQGRFELTGSQDYLIQISWAQGDESKTYGIGRVLLEKE